jgi:hypothetical protein
MKNIRAKSKLERNSSKAQKGKQSLQQTTMNHLNLKYVKVNAMLRSNDG